MSLSRLPRRLSSSECQHTRTSASYAAGHCCTHTADSHTNTCTIHILPEHTERTHEWLSSLRSGRVAACHMTLSNRLLSTKPKSMTKFESACIVFTFSVIIGCPVTSLCTQSSQHTLPLASHFGCVGSVFRSISGFNNKLL